MMTKRNYSLTGFILTAFLGSLILWNFGVNRAAAQKSDNFETVVSVATEYNARNEFALTQGGTSGVWRYGYTANDASNTFVPYSLNYTTTDCGAPADVWRFSTTGDQVPVIVRYQSPTGCQGTPPDSLLVHPGSGGERAILRFTAPAAGTYQLTGVLQRANPSATTDIRILQNETTSLFTGDILSKYQQAFNLTVTVAANDTIDFSVGFGNGSYNSDGSSLNVVIGQPAAACLTAPANLQVNVPGENSPIDVQSVNTNAALVGDAAYTNTGKVSRAFDLDGSGDYVRVEDNAAQRPATAVTTEGWFKFDSTGGIVSLISKPIRGSALNSYTLYLEGGQLRGLIGNQSQYTRALSSFVPQIGVWQHLAFTYDFTGGVSTLKLYANGAEVTSGVDGTANLPLYYDANPFPLLIGGELENNAPTFFLDGQADEVSVYGRALSQTEIFDIVQQGSFGKCPPPIQNPPPPFAVTPPANQIAWFSGDGDTRDFLGLNPNGILRGDANFKVGKVGQAFNLDGSGDYIEVADDADHRPATQLTAEGWFKFNNFNNIPHLIAKGLRGSDNDSYVMWFANGNIRVGYADSGSNFIFYDTGFAPNVGEFNHYAFVLNTDDTGTNANTFKLYVGGREVFSGAAAGPIYYDTVNPHPLTIGADINNDAPGFSLNGQADEVSLYSRALSALEISAIYNAGSAGKLKSKTVNLVLPTVAANAKRAVKTAAPTQAATVQLSDATVTFANITASGTVSENGIDLGLLPPLPAAATFTGLADDISTTAAYQNGSADDVQVCFNLPSLAGVPNLRILHLENNVWVNRTAAGSSAPNLCTDNLTSLSPFVIAQVVAPTAADASISGRVTDDRGRGIRNVRITVTDLYGAVHSVVTGSFGNYRFSEIRSGRFYTVGATAKNYTFSEPILVVNVNDAVKNLNFTAISKK